jgi:hypothetical protein
MSADPHLCSMNSMSSSAGIIDRRAITAMVGPLAEVTLHEIAPMCRAESFQTTHSRRCRPSSSLTAPSPSRSRASRDPGRLKWVWRLEDGYRPIHTSWRVSRLPRLGPCPLSARQSAYVWWPHPRVGVVRWTPRSWRRRGPADISGFANLELYSLILQLLGLEAYEPAHNGTIGFWDQYIDST